MKDSRRTGSWGSQLYNLSQGFATQHTGLSASRNWVVLSRFIVKAVTSTMRRPKSNDEVRKGAWSEDEDEKLRKYVETYGPGHWGSVGKQAGMELLHYVVNFYSSLT